MAEEGKGRGRGRRNPIEAARAHLGENNGESGDNAAPEVGDKTGEFSRRDFQLDDMQRTALADARETDGAGEAGKIEEEAFWRAAGDRLGFNHTTVEEAADFEETGSFTAYPADGLVPSGTGDLHEQHESALGRMEQAATDLALRATSGLVFDVRDFLLDQIKARPKPWSATSQDEQRDIAAACEHIAKELVRKVIEAIASDGRTSIRALLVSYGEKDGIEVKLKVKTFDDDEALAAVVGLHQAQGKHVMITVASADPYAGDRREAQTEPDAPELSFEAGSDERPAGDEDLAGAGDDDEPEVE